MAFESPPDQLPLGGNGQTAEYQITRAIGDRGGSSSIVQGELLEANAWVNQRQKDVADQRSKNGQRADQQDEGTGQVHVLAHEGLQQQWPGWW